MIGETVPTYPGRLKSRINRAVETVHKGIAAAVELQVIEEWRAAHRAVFNTFQAIMHNLTKGTGIIFAQTPCPTRE
jgi:putative GTP pyrophosphokinase